MIWTAQMVLFIIKNISPHLDERNMSVQMYIFVFTWLEMSLGWLIAVLRNRD